MSGNSTRDLVEVDEESVSFLGEMLKSGWVRAGLGVAVVAAVPAAFVGGAALALFPVVAYAGGTAIAGLFVPSTAVFRARTVRRMRSERRDKLRTRFLEKLAQENGRTRAVVELGGMALIQSDVELASVPWHPNVESYREQYARMMSRLDNLARLAGADDSAVSLDEVERLQDASVDFLRLVYARLNLLERLESSSAHEVELRLADLETQLETAPASLRAQLQKAKLDLERTAAQVGQLPARDAAVAAQLLHMSETMEELYHRITADPAGANLSSYMSEATAKLSIEEELQWSAELEVAEVGERKRAAKAASAARQAQ